MTDKPLNLEQIQRRANEMASRKGADNRTQMHDGPTLARLLADMAAQLQDKKDSDGAGSAENNR